jgi:hypothetical protein
MHFCLPPPGYESGPLPVHVEIPAKAGIWYLGTIRIVVVPAKAGTQYAAAPAIDSQRW